MSSYQCGSHTIRINDPVAEEIIDIAMLCGRVCGKYVCQRCAEKRGKKIAREIDAERNNGSGRLQWLLVDESDSDNIKNSLKRWMTRYRRLPLEDGVIFIFEDDHRVRRQVNPLPENECELEKWIETARQTPKGSRMSGTRVRKDKETGEVLSASWGYPWPKPPPVEGRTASIITLPSIMLQAYSEPEGAQIKDWHGLVDEYGKTKYKATADAQEAIMEVLDLQGYVVHPDEPIFDTSGTDHWEV